MAQKPLALLVATLLYLPMALAAEPSHSDNLEATLDKIQASDANAGTTHTDQQPQVTGEDGASYDTLRSSDLSATSTNNEIFKISDATTVPLTCPSPSQLVKTKDNLWQFGQFWRSFEASFAQKLNRFQGAQWQGSEAGNIICIYTYAAPNSTGDKDKDFTFPVEIYFTGYTKLPDDKTQRQNWVQVKNNYFNCLQPDVKSCPFLAYVKNTKKIDYYKTAIELRKQHSE